MVRPLRIDLEGGWYHVMSRGTERRTISIDKSYCFHFLELLGEMSGRYGVEVHAFVLMGYHLILRTPAANASAAMQWLDVSFSAWSTRSGSVSGTCFKDASEALWLLVTELGCWT